MEGILKLLPPEVAATFRGIPPEQLALVAALVLVAIVLSFYVGISRR